MSGIFDPDWNFGTELKNNGQKIIFGLLVLFIGYMVIEMGMTIYPEFNPLQASSILEEFIIYDHEKILLDNNTIVLERDQYKFFYVENVGDVEISSFRIDNPNVTLVGEFDSVLPGATRILNLQNNGTATEVQIVTEYYSGLTVEGVGYTLRFALFVTVCIAIIVLVWNNQDMFKGII